MPFTATDCVEPKGELEPADIWPDLSRNEALANISEYLAEGYARSAAITDAGDKDEAARQWTYHRGHSAAYKRLLLQASTVEVGNQGSSSWLLTQIEHVGELAEQALAEFNALLATVDAVETLVPARASTSVPVQFVF